MMISSSPSFRILLFITSILSILHVSYTTTTFTAPTPISIDNVNLDTLLYPLSSQYLAINIDTGSLYNNIDFTSIPLTNLLKALSPVILRVGGGAADSTLFTGDNGPSGNGGNQPWSNTVVFNSSYWDSLLSFVSAANAQLVWDLNGVLRNNATNSWDPTINATALFTHIVNKKQESLIKGFQLGNEPNLWKKRGINVNGTLLGQDYITLSQLLQSQFPTLPNVIYGPDGCCGDDSFLQDFLPVVYEGKALHYLSEHYYPITPNGKACTVDDYLTKSYYDNTLSVMQGYQSLLNKYAPTVPLVLGETATTNMGGCPNFSDRFIAGFYYMYILGGAAANGIVQINRQDLAGWSSQTEPSQYMLAGLPGWTNGTLTPHPDYFTSVLWQQIVQKGMLNISWSSSYQDNFGIHASCANSQYYGKGSIVLSYVNTGSNDVQLNFNQNSITQSSRTQFILASQAAFETMRKKNKRDDDQIHNSPPSSLTDDTIFLNGALLTVNNDGVLPQYPLPGQTVPASTPVTLPAYTYGFMVFTDVNAQGCM